MVKTKVRRNNTGETETTVYTSNTRKNDERPKIQWNGAASTHLHHQFHLQKINTHGTKDVGQYIAARNSQYQPNQGSYNYYRDRNIKVGEATPGVDAWNKHK
eukprot:TRINITY_DN4810_c0_g3_i2.p1 TRINITY_DN4810_c0_g3~~TRINITY_DN4810_c0_g3_i2.p1  ORF type:complete len:102 (-),score=5.36 TRINITY_DN4810_c0_g3_i2:25-330(-)